MLATGARIGEALAVVWASSRFLTGARLEQPLFPDLLGGFRDPANVRRELREARGEESLAWVTSHSFRNTTATILDEAALAARLVADQLGHVRPSMTQEVDLGRRAVDAQAAQALEVALGTDRTAPEPGHASQPPLW
jgi:integrase